MVARLRDAIQRGTTAAKPAATAVDVGTLYFDTDLSKMQRSDGSAWQDVAETVGSGAAPTTATYVTTTSDATLSAEVVHPELQDGNSAGSAVDMSAAAVGTGVTANAVTGMAGRIVFSAASYQYWDVASVVGTGDFDYRCRIVDTAVTTGLTAGAGLYFFGVSDSARTSTTGLYCRFLSASDGRSARPEIQAFTGLGTTAITPILYSGGKSYVLRVVRVGTSVTRYVSFNEGLSWITLGNSTSSLDVAKVGLWGNPNGNSTVEALVHWVRSF